MKRLFVIAAVLFVAALIAAGVVLWQLNPFEQEHGIITLYGNVEIRDVQLAFTEQDEIVEVLVEEGESVEAGQVLARLTRDRREQEAAEARAMAEAQRHVVRRLVNGTRQQEIDQARARVHAAETRVQNAERQVQRLLGTIESGATSQQALDDAQAAMRVEEAQLNVERETLDLALEGPREEDIDEARSLLSARNARVALLETRLDDTELGAPADGIIRSRLLEPGDVALLTKPVFVLSLTDPKWIRAYLPEPQLGHVKPGMEATIISDSVPDDPFTGRVGFLSPEAEFTPKNVQTTDLRTKLVYEVRIWVRDPHNHLRLGMPVTVKIDINSSSSYKSEQYPSRDAIPAPADTDEAGADDSP